MGELSDYVEKNKGAVFEAAEDLFGTHPAPPIIKIRYNSVSSYLSLVKSVFAGHVTDVHGRYTEGTRTVSINAGGANLLVRYEKILGTDHDFRAMVLDTLASEYGNHLYSSLHDWQLLPSAFEIEPMERMRPVAIGFMEAVGTGTMLKVAKALGQSDDYLKRCQLGQAALEEVLKQLYSRYSKNESSKISSQILSYSLIWIGFVIGLQELYPLDDVDFRALVRREPTAVWQEFERRIKPLIAREW